MVETRKMLESDGICERQDRRDRSICGHEKDESRLFPTKRSRHTTDIEIKVSKLKDSRTKSTDIWANISEPSHAILTLSMSNLDLIIKNVDENFKKNFLVKSEVKEHRKQQDKIMFRNLYGKGTNKASVALLRESLMKGQNFSTFVNLYRDDGVPLSCYVHLQILGSSGSCDHPTSLRDSIKIAILTVHSSSSISNAEFCQVGGNSLENFTLESKMRAIHLLR